MNNKLKVTGLLVGGYLLGRKKKLKLALTVAGTVSGSAIYRNREQIQEALSQFGGSTPELGRLAESAQGIFTSGVTKLQDQTEKINASLDEASSKGEDAEPEEGEAKSSEPADAEDEEAPQEDSDDGEAAEEQPEEEEKPAEEEAADEKPEPTKSRSSSGSRKTPAKRSSSGTSKSSTSSSNRKTSSAKSQGAKK